MIGALSKLTKLQILPLINTKSKLYLCYYANLLTLIYSIIMNNLNCSGKPIVAANQTPYTAKQILKLLGDKILLSIPWQPLWLMLKILETCGLKLKIGSDNLISLVNQDPNPDFSIINSLKMEFKDFNN